MAVDQTAGVPDGWEVVSAAPPPAPAESTATAPVPRMPAGVPARGRGTQFNPTVPNQAVTVATTPLAHPTGIDAIDGMTSPVGLASLAAGGYGIATAGAAEGAVGAARAGFAAASPILKYEAAKHLLLRMGVPSGMAELAAATVSGIKGGAKAAPAEAAAAAETAAAETAAASESAAPAAEAATAAQSGPRTVNDAMAEAVKKYQAEAKAKAAAKAASATSRAESAPGGTAPRTSPPTSPATPESVPPVAAAKVKLTGTQAADLQTLTQAEGEVYLKLRVQGKTHQQARDAIAAMRTIGAKLPTDAQMKAAVDARNTDGRWKP